MLKRPWLLIPVKSLCLGKSRLETTLAPVGRQQLNEFFLQHMIKVATQFPGRDRTAVVSDADDSLGLAAKLGVRAIRTTRQDLNAALDDGCRELRRIGGTRILIMPVDLPLIEAQDIHSLVTAGERYPLTICPDHESSGTNALMLAESLPLRFSFGEDSYRRHQAEARRCGITPLVYFNTRIAHDIDCPADLTILDAGSRWIRKSVVILEANCRCLHK
jgi:2-phospho-L-lactate guanylyltransferase